MRSLIIIIGDILIVPFSYVAGYYLRFGTLFGFEEKIVLWFIPLITLSYLAIFHFFDLYRLKKSYFTVSSFLTIFLSVVVAAVFVSFLNYAIFLFPIGRGILVIANLILLSSALVWRSFCYQLFKYLIKPMRIIIAGAGKAGQEIAQIIDQAGDAFKAEGFIEDDEDEIIKSALEKKIKILGTSDKLLTLTENYRIDQIVLAQGEKENPQLTKDILSARLRGIEVIDMPNMYQALKKRIPVNYVDENWFLKEKGFEHSANILVMKVKRLIDIAVSSIILLISIPLWPLIVLFIKVNSRGPVFYTQQRVGKNECLFTLYKFRSMIDKAEENEAVWADVNDKRITLVGKILRKLHLDELPQFWNVIKGDMSLV